MWITEFIVFYYAHLHAIFIYDKYLWYNNIPVGVKKIILTREQLSEVVGGDFSYLDSNENDGSKTFVSTGEIQTTPHVADDEPGDPLITDKLAKELTPNYFFGQRATMGRLACGKERKKKLLETNKDLEDKTFTIPDKLYANLKTIYNQYGNKKNIDGIKRLKNLINTRNISLKEMYRLKNFFENTSQTDQSFNIVGGQEMKSWVENELKTATDISYSSKDMKRKLGNSNAFIKTHNKEYGNNGAHSTDLQKLANDSKITYY